MASYAERAADRVSKALDRLMNDTAAVDDPQQLFADFIALLTARQPMVMQMLMEEHRSREAFEAALATLPAHPLIDLDVSLAKGMTKFNSLNLKPPGDESSPEPL